MNLDHFNNRSLSDIAQDRIERRASDQREAAKRAWLEAKQRGRIATAYCVDSADAQALIDYAEAHDLYLDRVLREADKLTTKRFNERFTSGNLCEYLTQTPSVDHAILADASVFVDWRDFLKFVWLCRRARVTLHFLKPLQFRFWRFTFTI